jgi:AmmeMemoRadiSam system protein A
VTEEAQGSSDPFVNLARQAIEAYVSDRVVIETPRGNEETPRRAGVFVSLHLPDGSLRGCIGTTEPHRNSVAEEVIANAVCAAAQDPRFYPLEKSELAHLDVTVDVLGLPEEVDGLDELDPKKYGVIVRTIDGRRALLLPDLEGVDTVEQQLRITCRKGGIDPVTDQYRLFRFEVERHH